MSRRKHIIYRMILFFLIGGGSSLNSQFRIPAILRVNLVIANGLLRVLQY
mgnify:CR=1 FL=1